MNRAVWIDAPGRLAVRPTEPGEPASDEVLVRVAWAGVCGSDRDLLHGTRPSAYVRYPIIPGHEWSGTVVAVGEDVEPAVVGKPVVGEGFRSCRRCAACRRGEGNLCSADYDETGFTRSGAWSNHVIVPARLLHFLSDGCDLRAAALLEPAACAVSAWWKAAAAPGERIAVVGAGTLGLLATQLFAAEGPAELVVVHSRTDRAALAEQCGAHKLITAAEAQSWSGHFDVVVEAAGAAGTAQLATTLARRGGRVVLIGIPARDDCPLSPVDLVLGEITLHTVFGAPSRAWRHAVRAFDSGVLDPAALITHELPLTDAAEAFRLLEEQRPAVVKIVLRP